MDRTYDDENNKLCFKLPYKIYENLNVSVNESKTLSVFWNSYQIFVFNNFKFNEPPNIFIPDFYIVNLLLSNNYLICLDNNGNVHLTPLKLKMSTPKKFKSCFQPQEQSIVCIQLFKESTISLKCVSNICYICTHKINSDFQKVSEVKLFFENLSLNFHQRRLDLIHIYLPTELEYNELKDFYKIKETWNQHLLIFISFDRLNIYSFLYNAKSCDDVLIPMKLYTSPSEIMHINVISTNYLNALLCLAIGTIIKIPLMNEADDISVVHLNTSIYKLFPLNDTMIYTDGNILWKSEKTFTENIKFIKCFVDHIKDFAIIDSKLLCTTFANLIYLFSIEDSSLFEKLVLSDTYCPLEKVLNNSDCLMKIMDAVDKSNQFVETIKKEEGYITTLSLANRHDVMDDLITYNVCVYSTFEDIDKEDLTLIDITEKHYYRNTFYILISIETKPLSEKFYEILSNVFGKLRIHLVLNINKKNIKTVSINVKGHLKNINIVVPHYIIDDLHKVNMDIKLITNIPGIFSTNENIWTVLHRKSVILNYEHFIELNAPSKNAHFFKEKSKSIDDVIYNTVVNQYGHLYRFKKLKNTLIDWALYVTLLEWYESKDHNEYLKNHINHRNAVVIQQLLCREFIRSKQDIIFKIGNKQVKIHTIYNGSVPPLLRIYCGNLKIAFHIRNFIAQYVYNNFTEFEPEKHFVYHSLYFTIERFERVLKDTNILSQEEFLMLYEEFQMNLIGFLPI